MSDKAIIWSEVKFVWVQGKRYQVLEGSVNLESKCLNAFCGDYLNFGQPKLFYFDQIERFEY